MAKPEDYTEGLGELVRAHRLYTGLSQRTFALRMGIKEKSLSDIEIGRRMAPRGFLDTVEKVVDEFDSAVELAIGVAKKMGNGERQVNFDISPIADQEWERTVIGRAAVESGLILPTLTTIVCS